MSTKKKKRMTLSEEQRKKLVDAFIAGDPPGVLATEFDISVSTVYAILDKAGVSASKTSGSVDVVSGTMKVAVGTEVRDAIVFLKQAQRAMQKDLTNGKSKGLSRSNLLALLALDALTGGAL